MEQNEDESDHEDWDRPARQTAVKTLPQVEHAHAAPSFEQTEAATYRTAQRIVRFGEGRRGAVEEHMGHRFDDALGGTPISVWIAQPPERCSRSTDRRAGGRLADDAVDVGADEGQCAGVHPLTAFSRIAHDEHRRSERRRLLLHSLNR